MIFFCESKNAHNLSYVSLLLPLLSLLSFPSISTGKCSYAIVVVALFACVKCSTCIPLRVLGMCM